MYKRMQKNHSQTEKGPKGLNVKSVSDLPAFTHQ